MSKKQKDEEGAIIGWSIGTGIDSKDIGELIDLPCRFSFKAIGIAEDGFRERLLSNVGRKIGRDVENSEYSSRMSSDQKYESITFKLHVETAEEVYSIYAAIKETRGIKMVL